MSARWWKAPEAAFLDRRLQRLPAGLFRFWFNLRCIVSWSGGRFPAREDMAFLLRTSPAALARNLDALREAGLLAEIEGELVFADGDSGTAAEADRPEPMTPAERQKRWRERKKKACRETEAVTESVTRETAIEREEETETDSPRHARGEREELFEAFLATFPDRGADNPRGAALAAWRRALNSGAEPEEIIRAAKAYAGAVAGRERRFICSAARWLAEGRWRGEGAAPGLSKAEAPPASSGVWIAADSPEGRAWAEHWRATRGKSPPMDARGGWRFPSLAPPNGEEIAA